MSVIYTSTTAMLAFSNALDVISNNVANLNTNGFKRTDLSFSDQFYRAAVSSGGGRLSMGTGSDVGTTTTVFAQGDLQDTGGNTESQLDLAIDGDGFFVLVEGDQTYYTRNGEFEFDEEGFLAHRASGSRLQAFERGALADISLEGIEVSNSVATSEVTFSGELLRDQEDYSVNLEVIDDSGLLRELELVISFDRSEVVDSQSIRFFSVDIEDEEDNVIASGEIGFLGTNEISPQFQLIDFALDPLGAGEQINIALDFEGTTVTGLESTLEVDEADGYREGTLAAISINNEGALVYRYTNDQEVDGPRVAIALISGQSLMESSGNNLFTADHPRVSRVLTSSGQNGAGQLRGGQVELSNVDLTSEFSEIIINQRGFQASSQLLGISNELINQLLSDSSGRG